MNLPVLVVFGVIALALMAGCATTNEVYLADGSKGMNISCPGAIRTYASCLERAGEICGARGYEVVNREGDSTPFAIGSASMSANRNYASGSAFGSSGSLVQRNIFVRCK